MDKNKENWKEVIGYEGLYQVSDIGNVKSLFKKIDKGKFGIVYFKAIILKKIIDRGYVYYTLYKNKKGKKIGAHRLVAKSFITNDYNKPFINHKNGIKSDNRVENLEWCTPKENSVHASKNNLVARNFGENNGAHKLTQKDVDLIRNSRYKITRKQLSIDLKVSIKHIDRIRGGERWINS